MTSSRGRTVLAAVTGGLALLWLLAIYLPMPIFALWELRLIARETALLGVLGALSWMAAERPRGWKVVALLVAVANGWPVLAPLPRFFADGVAFSLLQYLGRGVATPGVTVTENVVLDPSRPELVADFYQAHGETSAPTAGSAQPFVVLLHGGSWIHGDKGEVAHVSRRLAAAGITVVDLRYRLSPAHPFPASVADAKCALGRLRESAARWQLDPRRAAYLGRSAGGQLALLAAYSAGDSSLPPSCATSDEGVQAVLALYPFTDVAGAYAKPPHPDPEETRAVLVAHFGGPPEGARAADYQRADPRNALRGHAPPPTLLIHGSSDLIVPIRHSRRMTDPPNVTLYTLPFADHAFDHRPGGAADQLATAALLRFATRTLTP